MTLTNTELVNIAAGKEFVTVAATVKYGEIQRWVLKSNEFSRSRRAIDALMTESGSIRTARIEFDDGISFSVAVSKY